MDKTSKAVRLTPYLPHRWAETALYLAKTTRLQWMNSASMLLLASQNTSCFAVYAYTNEQGTGFCSFFLGGIMIQGVGSGVSFPRMNRGRVLVHFSRERNGHCRRPGKMNKNPSPVHPQVHQSQRGPPRCPRFARLSPKRPPWRAVAKTRAKMGCPGGPQRRAVPRLGRTAELIQIYDVDALVGKVVGCEGRFDLAALAAGSRPS